MGYIKKSSIDYDNAAAAYERMELARRKFPTRSQGGIFSIQLLGEDKPRFIKCASFQIVFARILLDLQRTNSAKCHYKWIRAHLDKRDGQPYSSWELAQLNPHVLTSFS